MGELDELFSRLKNQSAERMSNSGQSTAWPNPSTHPHQAPSVSSPVFSPPSHTPNPVHSSRIISPVNPSTAMGTPAPSDQNKTNNLLNLLRSSSHAGQSTSSAGPMANLQNVGRTPSSSAEQFSGHGRDGSHSQPQFAQDLMASLQQNKPSSNMAASRTTTAGAEKSDAFANPSHDSKQFLLNLLKKPSASATPTPAAESTKPTEPSTSTASVDKLAEGFANTFINPAEARASRESTPARTFGSPVAKEAPFEAPQPTRPTAFNYVNPFEQLHSSSPLNRTPQPEAQGNAKKVEILKHDREVSSNLNGESTAPVAKSRKIEGGPGSPSPVKAEVGKGQTVSEALEDVGETVDKQVEQALNEADAQDKGQAGKNTSTAEDATVIKKEPGTEDAVDSSWESAEDEEAEKAGAFEVKVYNFPMKAFVSIQVKSMPSALPVRQDSLTFIARMKKDFDQIDRNLVTASQFHIVYAPTSTKKAPHPGLRIIQQEFGQHKHIFTSTNERLFNVQVCSSPPGNDIETVLGTGVNGTIFWTSLSKSRGELFNDDDVEAQGFIMPPVATQEEQTSGSPVKTRAKLSTRHPEFFAVARGKQIHIIAPDTLKNAEYLNSKTKMVKSEKYLAEHGLKIATGKAGKDFCFSEDDTVIVSLDKSGRCKFWDVRELTSRVNDISDTKHAPIELTEPIWSMAAAASGSKADEKPSVSSIMFLDKEKPMIKGNASRYLLIGFKQNHILQLWDLGLSKAVQEVRLPHEKDSDGICSITYHPKTGVIAVGHPTRNSIFFVHLSAPMYKLPNMKQAEYMGILARNDPNFPQPSSTAIMSGLRELSFAKVGELRSVDMLRTPPPHAADMDSVDAPLFELYAMHSKGVVGISMKKGDLGWDIDNKVICAVDALEAGVIEINSLIPTPEKSAPSEQSSATEIPSKNSKAANKKQDVAKGSPAPSIKSETSKRAPPAKEVLKPPPRSTTPDRASKQVPEAPLPSQPQSTNPPLMTAESYAMAAHGAKSPNRGRSPAGDRTASTATSKTVTPAAPSEDSVSAPRVSSDGDLQAMIKKQFDALYQRIDNDKRVVDAAGSTKQEAVLRLVSSTLTENVEQSLHRIVSGSIDKDVLPAITNVTSKSVEKKLGEALPQQLSTHVTREVKAAVPHAVQAALKDPNVQRSISDQVATKVQQQVSQMLQQHMPNMAKEATQKMVTDLDTRTKQQIRELENRRVNDVGKIHELSEMVRGLTETIRTMSEQQTAFQEQMLKLQQEQSSASKAIEGRNDGASSPAAKGEDPDVKRISDLLSNGQYDAATLEWLQSSRQGELFDLIFVRVNPLYLEKVTPLVALSVSAAITASFGSYVDQRLEWLQTVLNNIDMNDEEIRDVAGRIMDVLSQRLQGAYMQVSEESPNEGDRLRRISALFRQVAEVRKLAG
ncbi:uncharacterized protein LTR77_002703 [Saxophila tyrrhenica]|uniref:EDC4-like protein pdc1 beta-propeller domain-containing protein n=1 Tax=Saxophila tyrrhenica TaxID=1690608 RepID=A0AAV9PJQ0_9PEZI|nr:hypothetical protein LTR77_002703 [Saxophila tyrrhenica]